MSATPYYCTSGNPPVIAIPSAATFKKYGGTIIVGNFYVYYKDDEAPHFFIKEKVNQEIVGNATQFRDAIRLAAKLDRQRSLSTPAGDGKTKTDSQAA